MSPEDAHTLARHMAPEVSEHDLAHLGAYQAAARLVVDGELANDRMWLQLEADVSAPGLAEQLQAALRDVTKLRGEVELVAPGSLPNDGHVIEDRRSV
jgi:predicted SprT family Zn-dependent metalloprotease